ncbi:hypothetical protein LguiB_012456 [Lonicera macranthoides]
MEGESRHRVALNPTLRDIYIEILRCLSYIDWYAHLGMTATSGQHDYTWSKERARLHFFCLTILTGFRGSKTWGLYGQGYADILEFLVDKWDVERLSGLSSEGRKAQDYACELAPRI